MEEFLFEIQQVKQLQVKQASQIANLKTKINEQKSTIYSLQQNFSTISTCVNVYIDTMKQLKTEYRTVMAKVVELDNKLHTTVFDFEQKVPDIVMLASLQEMHKLELQKIRQLELKVQDVEDQLVRFNTPTDITAHFNFECVNSVANTMSPLIL